MTIQIRAFLCAFLLHINSAHAAADLALSPNSLWRVVQLCQQTQLLTRIPFPCLEVNLQGPSSPGFAIVPTPGAAEVLLVPTGRLSGIESPQLSLASNPNWWTYAWQARRYLIDRAPGAISRNDIALAVNSAGSRSQDQLHIHIACVEPSIVRKVQLFERAIGETWSAFPVPLMSQSWSAMRLSEEDLDSDPFALLAKLSPPVRGPMADWGIAVPAWTFSSGRDGFIVLATRQNKAVGSTGSASALLDPSC